MCVSTLQMAQKLARPSGLTSCWRSRVRLLMLLAILEEEEAEEEVEEAVDIEEDLELYEDSLEELLERFHRGILKSVRYLS